MPEKLIPEKQVSGKLVSEAGKPAMAEQVFDAKVPVMIFRIRRPGACIWVMIQKEKESAFMEYRRFENTIVARIDKGEDMFEKLKRIAVLEDIKLAEVGGLGTFSHMNVGVYDLEERRFKGNDFDGMFEIVSLTGTINTMNGEYYAHLHASAADAEGHVFGGHLSEGTVGATMELVIRIIEGVVDREKDEKTGLNIFKFS